MPEPPSGSPRPKRPPPPPPPMEPLTVRRDCRASDKGVGSPPCDCCCSNDGRWRRLARVRVVRQRGVSLGPHPTTRLHLGRLGRVLGLGLRRELLVKRQDRVEALRSAPLRGSKVDWHRCVGIGGASCPSPPPPRRRAALRLRPQPRRRIRAA